MTQATVPNVAPPSHRPPAIGGQAVLEGVMMRGAAAWAVAVRLPASHPTRPGGIDCKVTHHESILARHRALRLPVLRGAVALVESVGIGVRALGHSANASTTAHHAAPVTGLRWALTVAAGLGFAVALFFLLPATITKLAFGGVETGTLFVAIEKGIRLAIFITYLVAVSRLPHLQRVFQYHAAEHQAIACHEAGRPRTPEQAAHLPRLHPRCGTSFMFLVMIVSYLVYAPLGNLPLGWLLLSRLIGLPLVAGLAFELIRWTARHQNHRLAGIVTWPGMQLQRMTTRPCDDAHREVAIAALTAVLDADAAAKERPAPRLGLAA